jgi:glutamyl-tRNA reductase
MHLVCFGLSHQTAEVDVRERFAFADPELPLALRRLQGLDGVQEGLILSTCNRVEHYVVLAPGAANDARTGDIFRHYCEVEGHTDIEESRFYHLQGANAAAHLFRVGCGLESMVLGETEILGQVKRAYLLAVGAGTTSRVLNKLFQRAFRVAKQVRSHTSVGRGSVSVGSAAVDLAEKLFGDLARCRVLILGAGETGEKTARHLLSRGVQAERLAVANRSPERAALLADALGGEAVPFEQWDQAAGDIDILITSTAAPGILVTQAKLEKLMAGRRDRPLFVIDIAVPRNVDPAANDLEGVYLYDIDSLQAIAEHAMASRHRELEACEKIIERHVLEFGAWWDQEGIRLGVTSSFGKPGTVAGGRRWQPIPPPADAAAVSGFSAPGNDALRR